MSHNASAVIQQQVEFVDSYTGLTIQGFGYLPNTGNLNCNYNCTVSINNNADLMSVINTITFNIPAQNYYKDGIIEYSFTIHKVNNSQSLHDFIAGWHVSDNNFKLMSVEIENQDTNAFTVHLYLKIITDGYASYFILTSQNINTYLLALQPGGRIAVSGMSLWRVVSPETNQNIINAINNQPNYTNALNDINSNIQDVTDAIEQQQEQERQETQDAVDDSQSGADDAQADSEAATSSLLSVITGFFGAMANLDPTDCKFDSHLPFLSGSGQIDLCTVPAPAIVQTIGSLILIGIMVPFAIHMYNRFISITGSFQK